MSIIPKFDKINPLIDFKTNLPEIKNGRLDISEIWKFQREQEKKKLISFEFILQKCHKKIQLAAVKNLSKCNFEIPMFSFEVPPYDIKSCIAYVIYKLKKEGFQVNYIGNNSIDISWYRPNMTNPEIYAKKLAKMYDYEKISNNQNNNNNIINEPNFSFQDEIKAKQAYDKINNIYKESGINGLQQYSQNIKQKKKIPLI